MFVDQGDFAHEAERQLFEPPFASFETCRSNHVAAAFRVRDTRGSMVASADVYKVGRCFLLAGNDAPSGEETRVNDEKFETGETLGLF